MSTFSALKMGTTGDSEWHESLGKSLNSPFLLRFYERCFKSENFRFSSTFPCSWDSNFKSRWTIWASRRYWISVFRLFRVPVTVFQPVSVKLLSVSVSALFSIRVNPKKSGTVSQFPVDTLNGGWCHSAPGHLYDLGQVMPQNSTFQQKHRKVWKKSMNINMKMCKMNEH